MAVQRTMVRSPFLLLFLELLFFLPSAWGYIGSDGRCGIHVFAPFTFGNGEPAFGLNGNTLITAGHSMMITALLAMNDFNNRNVANVPELAQLGDCNVSLSIDRVFDTGSRSHQAVEEWFEYVKNAPENKPCAFAGPYHDLPAIGLGAQAVAARIPMVVARSFGLQAASQFWNPFTTQVYPDLISSSRILVSYLQHLNRTNFVAIVHTTSILGIQRREALAIRFDEAGIRWISSPFDEPDPTAEEGIVVETESSLRQSRTYTAALKRVQESGFRTIILAMDNAGLSYPQLANAAAELGMNTGDHFYITFDTFDSPDFAISTLEEYDNFVKLSTGSSFVVPLTRDLYALTEGGQFLSELYRQDLSEDFLEQIRAVNPIGPNDAAFIETGPDYFTRTELEYGSPFMYDSVMSIGFGACGAKRSVDGSVDGADHHLAIQNVSFLGATGRIEFGNPERQRRGSRRDATTAWVVVNYAENFVPIFPLMTFPETDPLFPFLGGGWINLLNLTFIYPGNRTEPPLLRDTPEKNFVPRSVRKASLFPMCFVMATAVVSFFWVLICRKHRVLAASQPVMLYLVCVGTFAQASSCFVISFDESYVANTDFLGRMCMSLVWLFALGHMMVYTALFTRLWRVHKVLQFARRAIKIRHVAGPMAFLLITAFIVLVCWTVFEPVEWERREIDLETGESLGRCVAQSKHFLPPLAILMTVPTLMTLFMAYQTKDVDAQYSDSWWVFVLILVHLELVVIATPILVILVDEVTDASFIITVLILLSFPATTLGLTIVPKLASYVRAVNGWSADTGRKRGERAHGRVTGVERVTTNSQQPTTNHQPSSSNSGTKPAPALQTQFVPEMSHTASVESYSNEPKIVEGSQPTRADQRNGNELPLASPDESSIEQIPNIGEGSHERDC